MAGGRVGTRSYSRVNMKTVPAAVPPAGPKPG
jgi:hypothetical protein